MDSCKTKFHSNELKTLFVTLPRGIIPAPKWAGRIEGPLLEMSLAKLEMSVCTKFYPKNVENLSYHTTEKSLIFFKLFIAS